MQKLNFQDASFLRTEVAERPFHVGALMIYSRPKNAGANYMRRLATAVTSQVLSLSPIFMRKLKDPYDMRNPCWIEETEIDSDYHFRHYALPQPGKIEDLMRLVALAHQPVMDRGRPLWEYHLIDGLPGGRFAVYAKLHHALIDGMGGIALMGKQMNKKPRSIATLAKGTDAIDNRNPGKKSVRGGWFGQLEDNIGAIRSQARALPEVASQIMQMGRSSDGAKGLPPLPFTAPNSILNLEGGARRQLISLNLPLEGLRDIGRSANGTINDALIAVFGGALRAYLLDQNELPKGSLVAALPVSVKSEDDGNSLSMALCPLASHIADPQKRLQRIVKVTTNAKSGLNKMSKAALQDMMNLIMMPVMALSMSHLTGKLPPIVNLIISNVPGPKETLYLADSRLEAIYPISLLTESVAFNFTAISYRKEVCIGAIACPDGLADMDLIEGYLRDAYEELLATV
jgi:diacylglycerol O-acyltransferase